MEYKKYRAKTLKEAKIKMLLDVGRKGIIIKYETVKEGGVFGLFGTPMIELTVGVLDELPPEKHKPINSNELLNQNSVSQKSQLTNNANATKTNKGNLSKIEQINHLLQQKSNEQNLQHTNTSNTGNFNQNHSYSNNFNNSNIGNNSGNGNFGKNQNQVAQKNNFENKIFNNTLSNNFQKNMELQAENNNTNNNLNKEELKQEIDELKKLVLSLANKENREKKEIRKKKSELNKRKTAINRQESGNVGESEKNAKSPKEFIKMILKNADFDDNLINNFLKFHNNIDENLLFSDKNYVKRLLTNYLIKTVKFENGIDLENIKENIITIVGPTGVGKTTTIAKLCAYFGIVKKMKVKLISIDNYRVGAAHQLKLYSDIMEIPFSKVNNLEEFESAIEIENYDIILIDTAGRNQKKEEDLLEIKNYLDQISERNIVTLVVSATTKYKDLIEIFQKFTILQFRKIIITKLDETNTIGELVSIVSKEINDIPISYVTTGQSVPKDISNSTEKKIIEKLNL